MTYQQALKKNKGEQAELAKIIKTLCLVHAANPELVYNGAIKLELTPKAVSELADTNPADFGNLMFA